MNSYKNVSRRSLLLLGGAAAGLAALPSSPASAQSLPPVPKVKPARSGVLSANGWPVETAADAGGSILTRSIPGTQLRVSFRIGPVEVLFSHLLQRYNAEVDSLREGDVVGFRPLDGMSAGAQSNHASGTAIDIRPSWYPAGVRGGYSRLDQDKIHSILADFKGVVSWGGNATSVDESHFEISVGPRDKQFKKVLRMLTEQKATLGNAGREVNKGR